MNDESIYKQNLLLEQRYSLLENLRDANKVLDEKANTVLQVGGLLVGLVATFSISDLAELVRGQGTVGLPLVSQIFLIFALGLFVYSVWIFKQVYAPRLYPLPGSDSWENALSKYIDIDVEKCFDQILDDLLTTISSLIEVNKVKSKHVEHLISLLLGQVIALIIAVAFA